VTDLFINFVAKQYRSVILAIDQLNAQIFFIISLLYSSTFFEHCCAHHQEVKLYYTASGRLIEGSLNLRTGRPPTECDDTRCCIIQFDLPMINTVVLEICGGI